MSELIKDSKELSFTVVAEHETGALHVDFKIYDHDGRLVEGDKAMYHKAGSGSYPDNVETLEEAETYIEGSVKWDGCSNWNFTENDRSMMHGCCKADIVRWGLVLGECYDMAGKLMAKKWRGS